MRKDIFRKGMVLGIIFLFIGASSISATNASLNINIEHPRNIPISLLKLNSGYNLVFVNGSWNESDPDSRTWNTIQDGIKNVTEGGTVFVYKGTYYGKIKIDKSLKLVGEDMEETIIDGEQGNTNKDIHEGIVMIMADEITITSFTIMNGSDEKKTSGITVNNDVKSCEIYGNKIIDCVHCIFLIDNNKYCIIYNNYLINHSFSEITGSGIRIKGPDSKHNSVFRNRITRNGQAKKGKGIYIDGAKFNTISGNLIDGNNNVGVLIPYITADRNVVYGNKIIDCGQQPVGLFLAGDRNIVCLNDFENVKEGTNYFHQPKSVCTNHWICNYYDGYSGVIKRVPGTFGELYASVYCIDARPANEQNYFLEDFPYT